MKRAIHEWVALFCFPFADASQAEPDHSCDLGSIPNNAVPPGVSLVSPSFMDPAILSLGFGTKAVPLNGEISRTSFRYILISEAKTKS
ncbi:MAG: hypothetical protein CME21_12490 [Gemmatimonadetes bacterium]|nr:hypothetical protein [Gemmatimonadota bacterium]